MAYNENVKNKMNQKFNPRQLAREQHNVLKQHVIDTLEEIINHIAVHNYDVVIKQHTFNSPAGDCMGIDSTVINFGYDEQEKDIYEVLNHLAFLNQYANGLLDIDSEYSEYVDYTNTED